MQIVRHDTLEASYDNVSKRWTVCAEFWCPASRATSLARPRRDNVMATSYCVFVEGRDHSYQEALVAGCAMIERYADSWWPDE